MKTTLAPLPRQQGIALLLMLLSIACVCCIPAAQAQGVRSADMLAHTCAGCHGTDGASAGEAMPTIGGFEKAYPVNVLTDYKNGLRPATIMDRIMRGYSDQEIAAIASWFAARPLVSTDRPVDGDLAQRGELVHLEHCETCHGDGGRGQNDKSPRLAGQWAPYIRHTLESCRAKGLRCKTRQGAERNPRYVSCPLSNEVLSGERDLESLTFDYRGLSRRGVAVMGDEIVAIDADAHQVRGAGGARYNYDKLILSPGVSFDFGAIDGMTAELAETSIPHAWKAGPQTLLLRRQLEAMPDGGVVAIVAPRNPFRCPPGPYERAAQIAMYFKHHKPKSKIMILDAKDAFSKQGLFQAGWREHYGDMIEWVSGADGGIIEAIDPKTRTLTGVVEDFQADVVNLIPHQRAAQVAIDAGLTDASGWCPVNPQTFESLQAPDIYVIGDAAIAGAMPKSGYAANSQGKVCAAAVAAAVNGGSPPAPSYVNTCYSILAHDHGISVAGVYELKDGSIVSVPGAGGLSALDADARTRAMEVQYAIGWFRNITADMFTWSARPRGHLHPVRAASAGMKVDRTRLSPPQQGRARRDRAP